MSQYPSSAEITGPHNPPIGATAVSPPEASNGSTHSHHTNVPGSARRSSRTLSAVQLEKKRANDREAQRAIRGRTKHLIETLENRVRELESGEAFQQLQAAIKEKEAVQAENVELKSRLASILNHLRPVFPNDPLFNETSNGSGPRALVSSTRESSSVPIPYSAPSSVVGRNTLVNSQQTSLGTNGRNAEGRGSISSAASTSWDSQRTNALEHTVPNNSQIQRPYEAFPPERHYSPPSISGSTTIKAEPNPSFSTPSNFVSNSNGSLPPSTTYNPDKASGPIHSQLPANLAPTCHYDKIVSDFTTVGKRQLASGRTLDSICGGSRPTLTGLTGLRSSRNSDDHYLSDLLIDLLKGFSLIQGLPEKISVVSNMFEYMRWVIQPSEETYNAVPPYMRPVEEQLQIPHPIWVDYLPWPAMRLKLLYEYPWLPLDNFFYPYCKSLSLDFPRKDVHSCLDRDPETEEMYIKPDLYQTIRQLDAWSVGSEFAATFPNLADSCRISDP